MAKKQGHYCRRCGRHRANEKFSGKGHAQHLCKDCQREQKQIARAKRQGLEQPQQPDVSEPLIELLPDELFDALDDVLDVDDETLFAACEELEAAEKQRRARRRAGRAKQKANEKALKAKRALRIKTFTEADLLNEITSLLQSSDEMWQEMSVIAQKLNEIYANIRWKRYQCKNFSRFIEKYPDHYQVKRNGMQVQIALNPKENHHR